MQNIVEKVTGNWWYGYNLIIHCITY